MRRVALIVCAFSFLLTGSAFCVPIGQAKTLPLGSSATVTGSVTLIEPTECYLESTNGTSGMWVQADTTGFSLSSVVNAAGVVGTSDGEIVLQNASLSSAGEPKTMASVGMGNRWLSGRIENGLLVTTWGKVTAVCYSPASGAHWFHIDDGSQVRCDYGDSGVVVYSDSDVIEGDYVRVTGISSVETALDDTTKLVRVIRTRSSEDVSCLQPAGDRFGLPFSDEFDSPTLDPRWFLQLGKPSYASLTANPGSLTLMPDPTSNTTVLSPFLLQCAPGNWDMEMKVTPQFNAPSGAYCSVGVVMNSGPFVRMSGTTTSTGRGAVLIGSVYDTPHTAKITLFDNSYFLLPGDTYWIRMRMRRPTLYVSVSADGVNYCPEASDSIPYEYVAFRSYSLHNTMATFQPLIDYIRFTHIAN